MDMNDGERLRQAWAAKGSPPCDHVQSEAEYYGHQFTGDHVCTECGHLFEGRLGQSSKYRRPGEDGI